MHWYNRKVGKKTVSANADEYITGLDPDQGTNVLIRALKALLLDIETTSKHNHESTASVFKAKWSLINRIFQIHSNPDESPGTADWFSKVVPAATDVLRAWAREFASVRTTTPPLFLSKLESRIQELGEGLLQAGPWSSRQQVSQQLINATMKSLIDLVNVAKEAGPNAIMGEKGKPLSLAAVVQEAVENAIKGQGTNANGGNANGVLVNELSSATSSLLRGQNVASWDTLLIDSPADKAEGTGYQKENIVRWNKLKSTVKDPEELVGTKVKVQNYRWPNPMPGTITEITFKEIKVTGKDGQIRVVKVPTLKIQPAASPEKIIDVSFLDPGYKVWIVEDLSTLPVEEYMKREHVNQGAIFVSTTDPEAIRLSTPLGEKPLETVRAIVVKVLGATTILKVMRGNAPVTIEVPTSSVHPEEFGAAWAKSYATSKTSLDVNDVVEMINPDPQKTGPYIVKKRDKGKVTILSLLRPTELIEVPAKDVHFIGEYDIDRGIVPGAYARSPSLQPAPVKPLPPKPAPKPAMQPQVSPVEPAGGEM